ncbi:MAG: ATP-binding protein [Dissulfurispiraceae bacterium]
MAEKKKAVKKDRIIPPDKRFKGVTHDAALEVRPAISDDLRRRAEKVMLKQHLATDKIPPDDMQRVVHELRVHQIELEMQNEELSFAQLELEASREKYFDLYNLAPVGYITLNEKGIITEANLTAAVLLGQDRSHLLRQPLVRFIYGEDQDLYYLCHKQLLETKTQQVCEMRMARKDGTHMWVRVDISKAHALDDMTVTKVVVADIDLRKKAEEDRQKATIALKESHEQLRHLAAHLQTVREEERKRTALEIHDELGQNLTALKMELSRIDAKLANTLGNKAIAEQLHTAISHVSATIGTVNQICTNLRPTLLDHVGIEAAIEWQAEEFQKESGVECAVDFDSGMLTVDKDIANALFRVFQEALANVLKHSQATKVEASLKKKDGKLVLEIHDNGVGVTKKQTSKRHSFGLLGMRELLHFLGGTLSVEGKGQNGTTVTVIIPASGSRAKL